VDAEVVAYHSGDQLRGAYTGESLASVPPGGTAAHDAAYNFRQIEVRRMVA